MAPISVYYVQWPRTPPMTIKIFESYVYDDDELCMLAYPKIKKTKILDWNTLRKSINRLEIAVVPSIDSSDR